jgi:hypothetical protein
MIEPNVTDLTGFVTICIIDRITWHEKCVWIRTHCIGYIDTTNWAMWQLGETDIYFLLRSKDATLYYLTWS